MTHTDLYDQLEIDLLLRDMDLHGFFLLQIHYDPGSEDDIPYNLTSRHKPDHEHIRIVKTGYTYETDIRQILAQAYEACEQLAEQGCQITNILPLFIPSGVPDCRFSEQDCLAYLESLDPQFLQELLTSTARKSLEMRDPCEPLVRFGCLFISQELIEHDLHFVAESEFIRGLSLDDFIKAISDRRIVSVVVNSDDEVADAAKTIAEQILRQMCAYLSEGYLLTGVCVGDDEIRLNDEVRESLLHSCALAA